MSYYPPPAFHFKVEVLNLDLPNENDVRFTDVGGLSVEMGTEEVPEGGENRFVQKYPLRAKYPELVLKRGLLVGSEVFKWMVRCIQDYQIVPKDIDVKLLNADHQPLVAWHLVNAYPTKWAITDFNAASNTIAIENLQMFYQRFTMDASFVPPGTA